MFLFRATFWLAIVIALIPVRQSDLPEGQRSISTLETVGLAQSVIKDLGSFCERNEDTCTTGAVLVSQMGAKAREGARIAYTWLDERYGDDQSQSAHNIGKTSLEKVDQVKTSSVGN